MAYEKSCCFSDGFLAYPMIKLPKTVPIPAPDPATPTVAAPAPMNLAAESMSLCTGVVWMERVMTAAAGLMEFQLLTKEGAADTILVQYILDFELLRTVEPKKFQINQTTASKLRRK